MSPTINNFPRHNVSGKEHCAMHLAAKVAHPKRTKKRMSIKSTCKQPWHLAKVQEPKNLLTQKETKNAGNFTSTLTIKLLSEAYKIRRI